MNDVPGGCSAAIFALTAIALALSFGANAAIFTVVNRILRRSLTYKDPDRLVMLWNRRWPEQRFR